MAGVPHWQHEADGDGAGAGAGAGYGYGQSHAASYTASYGEQHSLSADAYNADDAYAYGAYFTQMVSLPAALAHHIMGFLSGNDLRALGASCTSALALACDHVTHLTVRVPKCKLLQPMFRGTLARYGAVTHVTVPHRGAPPMDNLASLLKTAEGLEYVCLSGNGIGSLGITHVTKALALSTVTLRTLKLGENVIGDKGGLALAKLIRLCTGVTSLGLEYNLLGKDGATAIINAAAACRGLTHYNMSHNRLTDEGATALAKSLHSWPSLTTLGMGTNEITCTGASEVARALAGGACRKLVRWHLEDNGNGFGALGARAVCAALTAGTLDSVIELRLGGNNVGPVGAAELCAAASHLPKLRLLDLSRNGLAVAGTRLVPSLLASTKSLELLDLASCRIDPHGIATVAAALPSCQALRALILNGNDIGHHGSIALGESLPHASLTVLRMSDCCIGDYGMGFLAEGLARSCVRALDLSCNSLKNGGAWCLGRAYEAVGNTSVTSLNISANTIVVGVGASQRSSVLTPFLAHLPALTSLNVAGNTVGDDGLQALAHALITHTQVHSINLNGSGVTTPGVAAFCDLLPGLQTLRRIGIRANDITESGWARLQAATRMCPNLVIT